MAMTLNNISVQLLLTSTILFIIHSTTSKGVIRDRSFAAKSVIGNRTVTCSGNTTGKIYPLPMYTCHNIRVDGRKLLHGYDDQYDEYVYPVPQCSECLCGRIRGYNNDALQICRELMVSDGYNPTVAAAYVLNPRCENKGPEPRSLYIKDPKVEKYVWLDSDMENGYLTTLQCLSSK